MRTALICLVLLFGVGVAHDTPAQATKAYAPEDLGRLNQSDRVRVIENEYSDQSGGRRIPDDQLEFYLDQIRSGWRFSDIKNDISLSLGGTGAGWRPPTRPPIGGGNGGGRPIAGEVICESHRKRYTECRAPFRGRAELVRQFSDRGCKEGVDWGQNPGMIWVKDGCRGAFAEVRGGRPGGGHGGGWDNDRDYTVTCTSDNGKYRTCAWTARSHPVLIEQISRGACIEGRTWGYDRRDGLWVDGGCRGRFGTR